MQTVEEFSSITYISHNDRKHSLKVMKLEEGGPAVAYTFLGTVEEVRAWLKELALLHSAAEPAQK